MNETKATRYQRLKRRTHTAAWLSAGLTLGLVALTPAARAIGRLADRTADRAPELPHTAIALATMVGLTVLLWELAALPALLYRARRVDAAYARSNGSVIDVLSAQARATAVALVAALGGSAVFVASVRLAGGWGWALAGLVLSAVLAVAVRGGPVLLARLAAVRPLPDGPLADRLGTLAGAARVPVAAIRAWQVEAGDRTTALVTGVGRGRVVLISSEVLRTWADDEIVVMVAHELAHHAHHDLWRALSLTAVLGCGALGAAQAVLIAAAPALGLGASGDLASLPLVALVSMLVWVASTPLRHAQSRRHERRADRFALVLTGRADAFGAAVRRLGAQHLAEERPSRLTRWLYHRHPPVAERLALAEHFQQARAPASHPESPAS